MSEPGKPLTMQDLQGFSDLCFRPRQPIQWEWAVGSVEGRRRILQACGLQDVDGARLYGHPIVVDLRMPPGYVDLRPVGAGERL